MADRSCSRRLSYEATQVHDQEVECRLAADPIEEMLRVEVDGMPVTKPPVDLSLLDANARSSAGLEAYFQRNCEQCD